MKAKDLQNVERNEGHIKIDFNYIFGPKINHNEEI
jgi:hypothetical protein